MLLCRQGITIRSATLVVSKGIALLAVVLQAASAAAQVPSARPASVPVATTGGLEFTSPEAALSLEGYLTIEWSEHPGAFEYRLVDGEGTELYRGPFPKAFVSGLPNGEYAFYAAAFDESGQTLARTPEPYQVTVKHWPLRQAWLLFSIGLIVFLALIVVLVRGAIGAREAALEENELRPDRPTEASE